MQWFRKCMIIVSIAAGRGNPIQSQQGRHGALLESIQPSSGEEVQRIHQALDRFSTGAGVCSISQWSGIGDCGPLHPQHAHSGGKSHPARCTVVTVMLGSAQHRGSASLRALVSATLPIAAMAVSPSHCRAAPRPRSHDVVCGLYL